MNINFNLRSKGNSKSPINIVIRYHGYRLVYPSGITVEVKKWNPDKQKLNGRNIVINNQIDQLKEVIKTVYSDFLTLNGQQIPTPTELRTAIYNRLNPVEINSTNCFLKWQSNTNNITKKRKYIYSGLMVDHVEEIKLKRVQKGNRKGHLISTSAVNNYNFCMRSLRLFCESFTKSSIIPIKIIDQKFCESFIQYCELTKGYSQNSISVIVTILKAVLNEVEEKGYKLNPTYRKSKFIAHQIETDQIYLNETEINELFSLDLRSSPLLERTRDIFIIGCRTGLRFSDLSKLTSKNFETGEIRVQTIKTKEYIAIPIHRQVNSIRQKYSTENGLPEICAIQKFNTIIREVCSLSPLLRKEITYSYFEKGRKIETQTPKFLRVSSHTARRSFATNGYILGIPPMMLMAITGHRTESSFFKYIRMTANDTSQTLRLYSSDYLPGSVIRTEV